MIANMLHQLQFRPQSEPLQSPRLLPTAGFRNLTQLGILIPGRGIPRQSLLPLVLRQLHLLPVLVEALLSIMSSNRRNSFSLRAPIRLNGETFTTALPTSPT